MSIYQNYLDIKQRVEAAASKVNRSPEDVTVISVSKTFPVETVQQAIDGGITLLGENKIQEAKEKKATLKGDYTFHLIGHLQSNKSKDAVNIFDLIHSIDKLSTAKKLAKEAGKINKVQKILVQVNTSGEESKSGIKPEETIQFCKDISLIPELKLLGLMTIGPLTTDESRVRESFKSLRLLKDEVNNKTDLNLQELSMGMSGDFEMAIEEGATLVRVGSSIFGKRDYQK